MGDKATLAAPSRGSGLHLKTQRRTGQLGLGEDPPDPRPPFAGGTKWQGMLQRILKRSLCPRGPQSLHLLQGPVMSLRGLRESPESAPEQGIHGLMRGPRWYAGPWLCSRH